MRKIKIFLILFLGVVTLLNLSFHIDHFYENATDSKESRSPDLIHRFFGAYRIILSRLAIIKSEEYLHGGIPHPAYHDAFLQLHENEDHHNHHLDCGCSHENKDFYGMRPEINKAPEHVSIWNILPYIAEKMKIDAHIHLSSYEAHEIIPWYVYAVRLNPKDTGAFATGGYWIGRVLEQPDKGLVFLKEGLRANPQSWEIANEIAMIYLAEKNDYQNALDYALKAFKFLEYESNQKLEKLKSALTAAYCHEMLGNNQEAAIFKEKAEKIKTHLANNRPHQ